MVKNLQFTADITEKIKIKKHQSIIGCISKKNGKSYADTYNYNDSPTCKSIFGRNPFLFEFGSLKNSHKTMDNCHQHPSLLEKCKLRNPSTKAVSKKHVKHFLEIFQKNWPKSLCLAFQTPRFSNVSTFKVASV